MTLRRAAVILGLGFVVHNADHARRGLDVVRDGVVWGGTLAAMLIAAVLVLIWVRDQRAPAIAAVIGLSIAVGVSAVHVLPDWGPLSDSLPDGDVDALTWIAVFAEISGAALLGFVGLRIMRDNAYAYAIADWE